MKKRVFVLSAMTFGLICLAISGFVLVQGQKKSFEMPLVISRVALVSVLDIKMRDSNDPDLMAQFRLKNNSDKAIIAFTVESGGKGKDGDAFSRVSIAEETGPVARAKEEFIIEVPVGNFKPGMPLRINAIVFDDGSSSGEAIALRELKEMVERAYTLKKAGEVHD